MFTFITKRSLWFNIMVGVVLAWILFGLFLLSLGWVTGHGNAATVPALSGKSFEEAKLILEKAGFEPYHFAYRTKCRSAIGRNAQFDRL